MTVSSSTSKAGPYAGNGSTTAFAFAFYTQATTDIAVIKTDPTGADVTLTSGTDYTAVLNADQTTSPGGTVTLAVAPASGYQITVLRSIALTQGVSLPNQGGWYPKVVENAMDKTTMALQQLAEKVSRAVVVGVTQGDPTALINTITSNAAAAASSASAASGSASAAANSAGAASTSAGAAAGSASAASGSASAASASAAQAAAYAASRGGGIVRSARTANTILDIADATNLIDFTAGTFTQTFKPAAALANGWFVYLRNSGTGVITLDPNGAETIDGAATFTLQPGQQIILQCDGANFFTAAKNQPALVLLATITPAAAANIDLSTLFNATYDNYLVIADGLNHSSGSSDSLQLRAFKSGGIDTAAVYAPVNASNTAPANSIFVAASTAPGGSGVSFTLQFLNVNDPTGVKAIQVSAVTNYAAGTYSSIVGCAAYVAANAMLGFRLYWGAGANFTATGKIRVYGYL